MKNKKLIIGIIVVIIVAMIAVAILFMINRQDKKKAQQSLVDFVSLINNKNYDEMYEKVVSNNMNKEDFVNRNKNIYEGIDSSDIKVEINKIEKIEAEYQINYHEKMFTAAGEVEFDNTVLVEKENGEYKLKWSSNFIFPQLGENQKVRISTIKAKRGDILDRNNKALAMDGTILSVGIVPRKIRRK